MDKAVKVGLELAEVRALSAQGIPKVFLFQASRMRVAAAVIICCSPSCPCCGFAGWHSRAGSVGLGWTVAQCRGSAQFCEWPCKHHKPMPQSHKRVLAHKSRGLSCARCEPCCPVQVG